MSKTNLFFSLLIVLAGCSLLMADNWLRKHEAKCKAELDKAQEKTYPQPVQGPNGEVCFEVLEKGTFVCLTAKGVRS